MPFAAFRHEAALAQFRLSQLLPASGALDEATMLALGLDPPTR